MTIPTREELNQEVIGKLLNRLHDCWHQFNEQELPEGEGEADRMQILRETNQLIEITQILRDMKKLTPLNEIMIAMINVAMGGVRIGMVQRSELMAGALLNAIQDSFTFPERFAVLDQLFGIFVDSYRAYVKQLEPATQH